MALSGLNVKQTINLIVRRRPVLEPILRGFEAVLEARDSIIPDLARQMANKEIKLPDFQRDYSLKGVPVLSSFNVRGLDFAIRAAAARLLPLLCEQPSILPYREKLEKFFLAENEEAATKRERILEYIFTRTETSGTGLELEANIPSPVLDFIGGFVFSSVLRALASLYLQSGGNYPWDTEGVWQEGYCPFCGAYPSLGWLGKRDMESDNPYLVGGGGKKHLHCPTCGTDWQFRRSVCPACGGEGDSVIQILKETGCIGERLDWCTRCKTYCPIIDLRELADQPQFDVMAIGMLHLDMMAKERNLQPLASFFWNTF